MLLTDYSDYKNIDNDRIVLLADYILSYFNKKDKEISLSFCDDQTIKELNCKYRNINKSTDVLSFALTEGEDFFEDIMLGDIIISFDTAQKQAEELNHPLYIEIDNLFCHGLLHLLGYDHINEDDRKIMFRLHKKLLCGFYELNNDTEYINDNWLM